ncbi:hypothetical protein IGW14_17720 [Streptomyces hygroscopicus subsp. hygroscopicus]|uniref:hypothetical protein n=1 Tax=Streptomyces hygroscopicus TaxID=1912 RepID=UPI0007DB25E5|nr:hypothetical protein [Streptomyces hygroscopicus]MBW8089804.1 hypothetical protein [Streptomyces hygroscopicus subsp. hygroscopicus]
MTAQAHAAPLTPRTDVRDPRRGSRSSVACTRSFHAPLSRQELGPHAVTLGAATLLVRRLLAEGAYPLAEGAYPLTEGAYPPTRPQPAPTRTPATRMAVP